MYVGAHAAPLQSVVIGEGSVIGACSVVTKTVPPFTTAVGDLCRVRPPRFSAGELRRHLPLVGSRLSSDGAVAGWKFAGLTSAEASS